jgi:hypothetical protein
MAATGGERGMRSRPWQGSSRGRSAVVPQGVPIASSNQPCQRISTRPSRSGSSQRVSSRNPAWRQSSARGSGSRPRNSLPPSSRWTASRPGRRPGTVSQRRPPARKVRRRLERASPSSGAGTCISTAEQTMPSNGPPSTAGSGSGSAKHAILPVSCGYARSASARMPADGSVPCASNPSSRSSARSRPHPQPTSSTLPPRGKADKNRGRHGAVSRDRWREAVAAACRS